MATPIVNRDGGFMWPGAVNRRRAFRTNPTNPNANNNGVSNRNTRKQVVALRDRTPRPTSAGSGGLRPWRAKPIMGTASKLSSLRAFKGKGNYNRA